MTLDKPRFVVAKTLKSGAMSYYFTIPTQYRKLGCRIPNQALGTDYTLACGSDGKGGRAAALNGLFDEWNGARRGEPISAPKSSPFGSVRWLFEEYRRTNAYLEKVSVRSRPDYERTILMVIDLVTKTGDRVGDRAIKAITPLSAEKIYNLIVEGPSGLRLRQGEKVVGLCARAWKVVHRLHPDLFDRDVPNPWRGVTMRRRVKAIKPAVTREMVYAFAWGCIDAGEPEAGAAAVICFEWLQRPENVLDGYVRWTDYRGREAPDAIRVVHHKTGAVVLHPLEEGTDEGTVQFYQEAEAVLSYLPRWGVPMILRKTRDGTSKPYSYGGMEKLIQRMRSRLGLPSIFTLDACRHGGMTELEEAELTDGQGRALSAHRSKAYETYAKRTWDRAVAATRKRYAHRLTNVAGTNLQNGRRFGLQNDDEKNTSSTT